LDVIEDLFLKKWGLLGLSARFCGTFRPMMGVLGIDGGAQAVTAGTLSSSSTCTCNFVHFQLV
jgi:hypothetical protein